MRARMTAAMNVGLCFVLQRGGFGDDISFSLFRGETDDRRLWRPGKGALLCIRRLDVVITCGALAG
jgi:hypothetical protein